MKFLEDFFANLKKKPRQSSLVPEISSKDFRSGYFTVSLRDDDFRILQEFRNCTNLVENHFDIKFSDELGMYRHFVGFAYTIEERP